MTVAGTTYTIGSSSAAATLSSLNGGGVGQVVTLLLGMNDEVVSVLTGDEADAVFYGVVQSSSRSLTEENGADVQQAVTVACTDGTARTVHVDKGLNYVAGTLMQVTVDAEGEGWKSWRAARRAASSTKMPLLWAVSLWQRTQKFWIRLRRVWLGLLFPADYRG